MAKRKMSKNSLKNLEKGKNTQFHGEIAVNAQKKSVAKRKENQTLSELMKIALSLPNEETGEINNIAITHALINKAIKGDVSAYQTIRDTIGEKPTDKKEITSLIPEIKVATEEDLQALEQLKNANINKGIS